MAKFLFLLATIICTFAFSLSLTWIFGVVTDSKETDRFVNAQEAEAKKREYRKIMETDSYEQHGGLLVSTSLIETSDRMNFTRRIEFHRLSQNAAERMQEMIRNVEIINKLPTINKTGETIGEKLLVRGNVVDIPWIALIWVDGSNLNIVYSDIVVNLIEFEKDHKDYRRVAQ